MKITFYYFIAIALLIASCAKELPLVNDQDAILDSTIYLPDSLKSTYLLNSLGFGLLSYSNDQEFKLKVLEECKKAFDEDTNVLFKNLDDFKTEQGILQLQNYATSKYLDISINENASKYVFKVFEDKDMYLEGINGLDAFQHNIYPQIYIPFIEKYDVNKPITIVVADRDGMETGCRALAYRIENNEIVAFEIDEEYAINNSVWVVSYSETVNDNGELDFIKNETVDTSSITRSVSTMTAHITRINVTDKKDCWYCGRGEVGIVAFLFENDFSASTCLDKAALQDLVVARIGNNDLNEWQTLSDRFELSTLTEISNLDSSFPIVAQSDGFVLAMFERDYYNYSANVTWPTPCGSFTRSVPTNNSLYGKWGHLNTDEVDAWLMPRSTFYDQVLTYGSERLEIESFRSN